MRLELLLGMATLACECATFCATFSCAWRTFWGCGTRTMRGEVVQHAHLARFGPAWWLRHRQAHRAPGGALDHAAHDGVVLPGGR
jgi:hypothetical protein